jgi:hypothetical protein
MLTKLGNEKRNDWDEQLGVILFAYRIAYKVSTGHTPFQLVYGLYPLMPTKYLLLSRTQITTRRKANGKDLSMTSKQRIRQDYMIQK